MHTIVRRTLYGAVTGGVTSVAIESLEVYDNIRTTKDKKAVVLEITRDDLEGAVGLVAIGAAAGATAYVLESVTGPVLRAIAKHA
jgi:hypothetical protein